MAYTTINKSSLYQNTVLYTGDGNNGNNITGVGFQSDLVWLKNRSTATYEQHLMNVLQGFGTGSTNTPNLSSNNDSAEYDRNIFSSTGVTADGFDLNNYSDTNNTSQNYAAWNWKAAGTTSVPSGGSITPSAVSINTTSGFGIYKYAGVSGTGTIAHGLGVAPEFVIVKDILAARSWCVYHSKNTTAPATDYLNLNTTAATTDNDNRWQDTKPTSTLISVGDYETNESGSHEFIMYAFAPIAGYSKFGGYTGNSNADGTFVYTGFKPSWVMLKRTDSTSNWTVYDNKRLGYNVDNNGILANTSDAEYTDDRIDLLSNGFKLRANHAEVNTGSYIYMAFGQPIISNSGVVATAR